LKTRYYEYTTFFLSSGYLAYLLTNGLNAQQLSPKIDIHESTLVATIRTTFGSDDTETGLEYATIIQLCSP